MRVYLDARVASAIRACRVEARAGAPQWCVELEGIEARRGVSALKEEFRAWGLGVFVVSLEVEGRFQMAMVDIGELDHIVTLAVRTGGVVSVYDCANLGGCTFDFSDEGAGVVDLLVTCWGNREPTADQLLRRFPEGATFRGN